MTQRDEDIEWMLSETAPRTAPVTPAVEDELARMSVRARTERARSGRRTGTKIAAGALAAVIVLGGAGAAAAASGGWWTSWWADEPDRVLRYTLPSGAECEHRIGGVMAGTKYEHQREFAREWYATADLEAIIAEGVDEQIAFARADREQWFMNEDGTREPAWYGTAHYPAPDLEYSNAVQRAISSAFQQAVETSGVDFDTAPSGRGLSIGGEINCHGAQW